jgi:3-oxoacyl-[acyl-carrier protein] reductase
MLTTVAVVAPRLDGRALLITGAASGIGRATALLAAAEGAAVAAFDIDERGLYSTVDAVRSLGVRSTASLVDIRDRAALFAAIDSVAQFGPFDGVFANAAVLPPPVPVEALDWDEWHQVLSINLTGAVMTLVSSLSHVPDGASLLVNGSSMAIRPREQRLAYVAAKAGLHAAARALALELAPRRIRVNVLAPGLTDTPMVRRIPGHIESGLLGVPLGELVPPEEVAALAVHLMSDDARHVTGAVFSVDGGRTTG